MLKRDQRRKCLMLTASISLITILKERSSNLTIETKNQKKNIKPIKFCLQYKKQLILSSFLLQLQVSKQYQSLTLLFFFSDANFNWNCLWMNFNKQCILRNNYEYIGYLKANCRRTQQTNNFPEKFSRKCLHDNVIDKKENNSLCKNFTIFVIENRIGLFDPLF